jgi:hypothetical protein
MNLYIAGPELFPNAYFGVEKIGTCERIMGANIQNTNQIIPGSAQIGIRETFVFPDKM